MTHSNRWMFRTASMAAALVVILAPAASWGADPMDRVDPEAEKDAVKLSVKGADASDKLQHERALQLHRTALKNRIALDDAAGAVLELHNVAVDLMRLDRGDMAQLRIDDAFEIYKEELAMGLGREKDPAMQEAMARVNLLYAVMLLERGSNSDADKAAAEAMGYCKAAKCGFKSRILNLQGRIAMALGDMDAAGEAAAKALKEEKTEDDRVEAANSHRLLAYVAESKGEAEKSIELFKKALATDRSLGLGRKIVMDLLGLAKAFKAKGDSGLASTFAQRAPVVANANEYEAGARQATEILESAVPEDQTQ